jgi:hypothetical protein
MAIEYGRRESNAQAAHFGWGQVCQIAVTPACAARVSNPVPPGKSRMHHPSCLQRKEPHRGVEPR